MYPCLDLSTSCTDSQLNDDLYFSSIGWQKNKEKGRTKVQCDLLAFKDS